MDMAAEVLAGQAVGELVQGDDRKNGYPQDKNTVCVLPMIRVNSQDPF